MASLFNNMEKLQKEYHIPMKTDLSTSAQIKYYESHKTFDSPKILDEVIGDLKKKDTKEYAEYISSMRSEDINSQWYE